MDKGESFMINVVVNIKSIAKYLLVFILASILIFFARSFFQSTVSKSSTEPLSDENSNVVIGEAIQFTDNSFFTKVLDQTIPGISDINNSNTAFGETSYEESINPLQLLLSYELPIMNSTVLALDESSNSNSLAVENSYVVDNDSVEHADTNLSTQVIDSGVPNSYTNNYNGVEIKNGTDYTLTDDVFDYSNLNINRSDIIIFHTHTCESYTPTEGYSYEESGTFRTIDLNYSVARVGDSLSEQLISYGYNVIHDKTYHDYPAYSGSYGRSMATVENLLLSHSGTDVIIDLHRDAIEDTSYAPSVMIGDETVAQLMFVIGTDGGGLEHPNWQNNLKFAVAVQSKANELYPGLFRPILLRNSRYNQQLGSAACIIEVGATGNTLEQAMGSMKYLALVLNEILK